MRYGVLADIHANLPALEAVLDALQREGVDAYICAGDLVGYGPFPNECVERVAALAPVCVAGNHDLIALGELSDERCIPLARESLRWTRNVLDEAAQAYLAGLPLVARPAEAVVVAHGSLTDPQQYTRGADQAVEQLDRLAAENPGASVLILGHTHRASAWDATGQASAVEAGDVRVELGSGGRWLLNPGAVGQSRERLVRARFMVLDLDRGAAEFHAVVYDVDRCRQALRRQGLSEDSVHLRSRLDRLAALLRRRLSPRPPGTQSP